jgi:3-methyladenine DNA glycosylase AlkD
MNRGKTDHHPMITKAVSWGLRETTKTHLGRVPAYLNKNQAARVANHIVHEPSNQLQTGLKSDKTQNKG